MAFPQRNICNNCPKFVATVRRVRSSNAKSCYQCPIWPRETILCGREKLEILKEQESISNPKVSAICGQNNEDPRPEKLYELIPKKRKNDDYNSLGDLIGLVKSAIHFRTDYEKHDIAQARFATYLIAFARFHLDPETTWNSAIIEQVLEYGVMLYSASQKSDNQLVSPHEIYTPHEQNILREFELLGCKFHIELVKSFLRPSSPSSTEKPDEAGDYNAVQLLTLKNMKTVLSNILRERTYYLLKIKEFYIMIWLNGGMFFIFDICGRRINDFSLVEKNGMAVLLSLKSLNNVNHLILNLSGFNKEDLCTIRELKIAKLVTLSGYIVQRDYSQQRPEYEIINDDYAYVTAKLHLSLNPAELLRNRSAMAAGVTALVVSKVNHPATWNTKIVDNIICFGVNFYQTYWLSGANSNPIDVNEFPNQFNIGQFRVNIEIFPKKYMGVWRFVPSYKFTDLAQIIETKFEEGDIKLLLQINYQLYTIWKQNKFIYMFDPFRHRLTSLFNEPGTIENTGKYATVRMFRSFDVFIKNLNYILMDSNKCSTFFLHVVKVRHIQAKNNSYGNVINEEFAPGPDGEVLSLNDIVCFEGDDEMCQTLMEISDFEDEELNSHIEELELRSTSSELDVMEEEIALEDTEDIEEDDVKENEAKVKIEKKKFYMDQKKRPLKELSLFQRLQDEKLKDKSGANKQVVEREETFKDTNHLPSESNANFYSDFTRTPTDVRVASRQFNSKEERSFKLDAEQPIQEDTNKKEKEKKIISYSQRYEYQTVKNRIETNKTTHKLKDSFKDNENFQLLSSASPRSNFTTESNDLKSEIMHLKTKKENLYKVKMGNLLRLEEPIQNEFVLDGNNDDEKELSHLQRWEVEKLKKTIRASNADDESKQFCKAMKTSQASPISSCYAYFKSRPDDMESEIIQLIPKKKRQLMPESERLVEIEKTRQRDLYLDKKKKDMERWEVEQMKDKNLANEDAFSCKDTKIFRPPLNASSHHYFSNKSSDMESGPKKQLLFVTESDRLSKIEKAGRRELNVDKKDKDGKEVSRFEQWEVERLKNMFRANKAIDYKDTKHFHSPSNESFYGQFTTKPADTESTRVNTNFKNGTAFTLDSRRVLAIERTKQADLLHANKKKEKESEETASLQHLEKEILTDMAKANKEYDECEESFKYTVRFCTAPNANRYPGYTSRPTGMAVVGSKSGSYDSLLKLICAGFKTADRILLMTHWKNFVLFHCNVNQNKNYFLYDGCIRDVNRFRHLDLSMGTDGLLCFQNISDMTAYIVRKRRIQWRPYLS